MKKKILAVILTLAMVLTMFSGCGKKDSTYFNELKEASKITTGTHTVLVDATYKGDVSDAPELIKNSEGNVALSLKLEYVIESSEKAGIKISAKLGQETDYEEITTLTVSDKKMYITVDSLITFVKKIDEDSAAQLESGLSSMGISGAISIDVDKVLEALGEEYPEISTDTKQSANDLLNSLAEAAENNFKDLEGQDGDDYTLKLNADNAETAVNGVINFLKNDAEGLCESVKTISQNIYGEDSEITSEINDSYDEIINQLPDAAQEVEDNKSDIVQAIKDSELDLVSKIQVTGKEGSRKANISVDSGTVKIDSDELNISISDEINEGSAKIEELVPENASDVTTMLITLFNQMSSISTDGDDLTGLY